MGQLGTNLGPTWANMAPLGQFGANMDLAKPEKLAFRFDGSTKIKGSSYHQKTKIDDKPIKNRCKFGVGKSNVKNRIKIRLGSVYGSICEGSGRVLGVSWALSGASGLLFGRSETIFF